MCHRQDESSSVAQRFSVIRIRWHIPAAMSTGQHLPPGRKATSGGLDAGRTGQSTWGRSVLLRGGPALTVSTALVLGPRGSPADEEPTFSTGCRQLWRTSAPGGERSCFVLAGPHIPPASRRCGFAQDLCDGHRAGFGADAITFVPGGSAALAGATSHEDRGTGDRRQTRHLACLALDHGLPRTQP